MSASETPRLGGNWRAVLICPNRGITSEISPLISQEMPGVPVFELPVYPSRQVMVDLMNSQPANLCFLDVSSDRERALSLIPELLGVEPSMKVLVLMNGNDPDLILRCLRHGAAEFLIRPFTADQFQPVIERLSKLDTESGGHQELAKIYCVMPAKGACGASTIASSLAFQLKRLGYKRILLADLDPLTGTVSFLLKLKSTFSFVDALSRGNLDADLWKGMITTTGGIDVLLSPDTPVDGVTELQDASNIVEYSRQAYDSVILDSSGAYGDWSLTLARLCDELLLVTTNELPALQATQRVLSYLDRHRVDRAKVRLLVNRYNRDVGLNKEMIETALRNEVFHLIPSDYESVQRALMEGKSISANCAFGKSMVALADRLGGRDAPAAPQAKKKQGSFGGLFSFLSR